MCIKRKKFDYFIDFNRIKSLKDKVNYNFKHYRLLIFIILMNFNNYLFILRVRHFHI